MRIKKIDIKNVKGIDHLCLDLDLIPNKPNIFVAPNGFGKSSFSIAFKSLNNSRLKLDKIDLHDGNEENKPELKIIIDEDNVEKILIANDTKNDINKEIDVFVINNQLVAKSTLFNISGRSIAKASLEILPNVIVQSIPERYIIKYSYLEEKKKFGENGKILPNIKEIFENRNILFILEKDVDFNKFTQIRTLRKIEEFKNRINSYKGSTAEIREKIMNNGILELEEIDEMKKITNIINQYEFESISDVLDSYLCAIQLVGILKINKNIKRFLDYQHYLNVKEKYIELLSNIDTTRFNKKPKEDSKKGLIMEWPKAYEISNGQRDILSFISSLVTAENIMNRKKCILIIDEVFDYLDDANLISCQYFITKYIEKMKKEGREFFPIIMTHLDPNVFNHFCFNKHKTKIKYMKEISDNVSNNLIKLIRNRGNELIDDEISKCYFHFYPNKLDISEYIGNLNLSNEWKNSEGFCKYIDMQTNKYVHNLDDYDSLAVCIGLRMHIEKYLYRRLSSEELKEKFLCIHGTKKKIENCLSVGIDVPDLFCLLGIIYNANLHIKNNEDIVTPLKYKLENITIRKMINSVLEYQ